MNENYPILWEELIQSHIVDSTGKMSKSSYFRLKEHQMLFDKVIEYTSFVEGDAKSTLRERFYAICHSITQPKLCVVCGVPVSFRRDGIAVGYPDTCSKLCGCNNPMRTSKRIETSLKKYNTRMPQQSCVVKDKARNTNIAKYGVHHKNQAHISEENYALLTSKQWLHHQHYVMQRHLSSIASQLGVDNTTVARHLNGMGLDTQHFFFSTQEREVKEYLETLGVCVEVNNRSLISPYELDIVMPDHSLAIEYCGLFWHSEQRGKHKNYHKNKLEACNKKGIQLLTIFSDEWINKKYIVKQKLKVMLGLNRDRLSARSCTICEVSSADKKQFFDGNHIQGSGPGSISFGLKHNNELVACMSFIHSDNDVYTLNRYATSKGIVGGFSKLLSHFKRTVKWKEIVSFADLRWSMGGVYKKTGWTVDKILPPDYSYSQDGHTRTHKFNYRRKYLPKLLKHFDPALSETQNCDANNVLRIWDCGKIRFILVND